MTRKSKRELKRAVEDLSSSAGRPAGLITIFSTAYNGGTVHLVDRERRLVRIDGDLRVARENALEKLDGWAWEEVAP